EGWTIKERPPRGEAALAPFPGGTVFEARTQGRFHLVDADGRELSLSVGRHDETPLDCGRSGCHQPQAEQALGSPMTHVLARGLSGELGPYPGSCALGCHSAG